MTFEEIKRMVRTKWYESESFQPKFVLVHADEFMKIMNNVDDESIHYEPTKDGWGRYYFYRMRIIRSIDVNPGEIIVV